MSEQTQDLGRIVALHIVVDSYGGDDRNVTLTITTDAGVQSPLPVDSSAVDLEDFDGQLAGLATQAQRPVGLRLGKAFDSNVVFEADAAGNLRVTQPVTTQATPVSDAALARLAAEVHRVVQAGQGSVDWAVVG